MGRLYNNLEGIIFGRLKVIELYKRGSSGKPVIWKCKCSCSENKYINVESTSLSSGHTRSCGCLVIESLHDRTKKYNFKICNKNSKY